MTTKANGILAAPGRLALALLVLLSTGGRTAVVDPFRTADEKSEFISFSIDRWYSIGRDFYRTQTQIVPTQINPPSDGAYLGNSWEFNRADASINLYAMEIRPWKRLSFDTQYAAGATRDGDAVEHDWINTTQPDLITYTPSGHTFVNPSFEDYGRASIAQNGSTSWLTTSLYFRALSTKSDTSWGDWKYRQDLDLLAGYDRYSSHYHMTQWNQTFSAPYSLPEPAAGIIPGNDSSITMTWQGLRMGVRETVSTDFGLKAKVVLAYSPLQSYGATGYNAQAAGEGFNRFAGASGGRPFASSSPNFIQRADGSIFDGNIGVSYSPIKMISIDAGWMFVYLWSRNGREKDFLPDGTNVDQELETVKSQRFGWYTGASLHF